MTEWLESLVPWGTETIVWAQSLSNGWLDAVFIFFTSLGYEGFYLFLLPLVYWCFHKRIGIGLAYVSLLSAWVNNAIKYFFRIPRPSDPRIRIPWPETGPSFPSGHAQNAVVIWGYLAYRFRHPLLWVVALVAILGIGLSRVVLGVHYPQDVIAGWLIGLALVTVYILAERPVSHWLGRQRTAVQVILAIVVPLVLMFLHPADAEGFYPPEGSVTPMSALVGLGIGAIMERAWVRFRVDGVWWRRGFRFLVGLFVAGVFYLVPKLVLPHNLPYGVEVTLRVVRYAVLGWVVAFLVPWIFVQLRLAEREGD
jgi:membrane-associated phospholipid phosphatase